MKTFLSWLFDKISGDNPLGGIMLLGFIYFSGIILIWVTIAIGFISIIGWVVKLLGFI